MGKTKTAFLDQSAQEPKKGKKGQPEIISMDVPNEATSETRKKRVHIRGSKHKQAVAKVDKSRLYQLSDAVQLVKDTSYSKFDGTVELHLTVKKEGISAKVALPHSTGSSKKIEVADEATIEKLKTGKIDFDVLLATPEMMPKLVPFARILGPKGMMPNPKNGTLIKSVEDAKKYSSDTLIIKTERKSPLMHVSVGKVSQKAQELTENVDSVLKAIGARQIVKASLCATMGPSVKIEIVNS